MVNAETDDRIWALRAEADESRRLAETLTDAQSVADLEAYALELEAEAAKLQLDGSGPKWHAALDAGKRDRRNSKRSHRVSAS